MEYLLQYYGTSVYSGTLGIEEAQTNVFGEHGCTNKAYFAKK